MLQGILGVKLHRGAFSLAKIKEKKEGEGRARMNKS